MIMTHKNQRVLDFVLAKQREHPRGMPPTLREIAAACNLGEEAEIKGAAAAQYHMKKLVAMGLAEETDDKARKYRAIDTLEELVGLQRAARKYKPEQIFSDEALVAWAHREGYGFNASSRT